jgi:lipoprotein-anchoring transpeptidase ErfK/SrfK
MTDLTRRHLMYGSAAVLAALGLAGCVSTEPNSQVAAAVPPKPNEGAPPPAADETAADDQTLGPLSRARYVAMYGAVSGDRFAIPAVKLALIKPAFLRQMVDYPTKEAAGTIIVDPQHHFLYHVLGDGRAMRYGVGVGREGFAWSGEAVIKNKQEWPDWYPPKEMVERQPELKKELGQLQSGLGMAGGPRNPLGVRAMYLWQNNKDTLFRIHGTVEPWTIGKSVSSGCIRMIDQDVIDLYNHTPPGTKVIVLGGPGIARLGSV